MSFDGAGNLVLLPEEAALTAAASSCIDGIIGIASSQPRPLTMRSFAHFYEGKPASVPLEGIIRQAPPRCSFASLKELPLKRHPFA